MTLYKEIFRDKHSYLKRLYNTNGDITLDEYKTEAGVRTKEVYYNDKKQIISSVEESEEDGLLSLYVYNGESYRVLNYMAGTSTYNDYVAATHLPAGKETEAYFIKEYKIENGILLSEHHDDRLSGTKCTTSYTYNNGVKTSETSITEDGTVTKTDYSYERNKLVSKYTTANNKFATQVQYLYSHQTGLVSEEHDYLEYKNERYTSGFKMYYYNTNNELEKTEYYGAYDRLPVLYKKEETIRKGNTVTKKHFEVQNAYGIVGHFDLAALHEQFKKDGMESAIHEFGKRYFDQHPLAETNHTIETLDDKGNLVEYKYLHKGETLAKVTYRNEYNDEGLIEFVISYRDNEEMDIRKYYYH